MRHTLKLFTLIALSAVSACALPTVTQEHTDQADHPIQQSEDQLLDSTIYGICYSGFRKGQHPDRGDGAKNPSESEIHEDLKIILKDTPFRVLRLYDSRENSESVLKLIKEHDLPFTVMLGAWLSAEVNNPNIPWKPEPFTDEELAENKRANEMEISNAIRLANQYPEIITSVAVGNEALVVWNDHMVPIDSVIEYVLTVKAAVSQPITVADNYDWWATSGAKLAAHLDFVSVHIYPVWEERDIDEGLSYSIANMQRVRNALPDAQLVITEAGWATSAWEFGDRASEAKQTQYFHDLYDWAKQMNITTFFFEAFDESWKGDPNNPYGAEKHWGIYFEDRTPKAVIKTLKD